MIPNGVGQLVAPIPREEFLCLEVVRNCGGHAEGVRKSKSRIQQFAVVQIQNQSDFADPLLRGINCIQHAADNKHLAHLPMINADVPTVLNVHRGGAQRAKLSYDCIVRIRQSVDDPQAVLIDVKVEIIVLRRVQMFRSFSDRIRNFQLASPSLRPEHVPDYVGFVLFLVVERAVEDRVCIALNGK